MAPWNGPNEQLCSKLGRIQSAVTMSLRVDFVGLTSIARALGHAERQWASKGTFNVYF